MQAALQGARQEQEALREELLRTREAAALHQVMSLRMRIMILGL